VCFNQQNLAVRAQGVHDLDIQRDLQRPARILPGIASSTRLVDLLEAAVRSGAGGKSELAAVNTQVAFNVWIVVGINNTYRLPGSPCARKQAIRGPELHRAIARRPSSGFGIAILTHDHTCMAASRIESSRSGAHCTVT